jgi:large subunit ribosomal protein L29
MSFSELSDQDLVAKMYAVERDLVSARFAHSTNTLENTAELRNLRKEIARLRTETRSRELAQGLAKDALIAKHRPAPGEGAAADSADANESQGSFLSGIVDKITGND